MLSASILRYLGFAALAVALMSADVHVRVMSHVRTLTSIVVEPLYTVSAVPAEIGQWFYSVFTDKRALATRYDELRRAYVQLRAQSVHHEAVRIENKRLRHLLALSEKAGSAFQVAELLTTSSDARARKIMLAKGSQDGVYAGQLVMDTHGVYGQVSRVGRHSSAVLLLTSASHSIPVRVHRNGLQGVVYGLDAPVELRVTQLAPLADIKAGDVLVTSGMGQRFPPGYPVARVSEVKREKGDGSIHVRAVPLARFGYNKEVLLVRPWALSEEGEVPGLLIKEVALSGVHSDDASSAVHTE